MSERKHILSDPLWEEIRQYIPARENTHPRGGGRKPKDDRLVFEAILFVLRYGCQWNALNASGLCPSSTVHDRFQKWAAAGVFHRLGEAGLLDREMAGDIDWSWLSPGKPAAEPGIKAGKSKRQLGLSWRENRRRVYAPGERQLAANG